MIAWSSVTTILYALMPVAAVAAARPWRIAMGSPAMAFANVCSARHLSDTKRTARPLGGSLT